MEYFLDAFRIKYAEFDGRARRKEYWMFALYYFITIVILSVIDNAIFGYPVLYGIAALAALIPSIAIGIRRLHDIDKSGWWLLISLVPIVGAIVLLVFACTDGTPGENQYGPNPKEIDEGVSSHLIEEDIV